MHEGLAENDAIPVTRRPEKGHEEQPLPLSPSGGYGRRKRAFTEALRARLRKRK